MIEKKTELCRLGIEETALRTAEAFMLRSSKDKQGDTPDAERRDSFRHLREIRINYHNAVYSLPFSIIDYIAMVSRITETNISKMIDFNIGNHHPKFVAKEKKIREKTRIDEKQSLLRTIKHNSETLAEMMKLANLISGGSATIPKAAEMILDAPPRLKTLNRIVDELSHQEANKPKEMMTELNRAAGINDSRFRDIVDNMIVQRKEYYSLRNEICNANQGLLTTLARQYGARSDLVNDLIQEGNKGLLRAIEHFDVRQGNCFSTYAVWAIKNFMSRAIDNYESMIKVPYTAKELKRRYDEMLQCLHLKSGLEPGFDEVIWHMGISKQDARLIVLSFGRRIGIYNAPEEDNLTFTDWLVNTYDDNLRPAYDAGYLKDTINCALSSLSHREKIVIQARYGISEDNETAMPMTLEKVGEMFRLTKERIRQIEETALRKLKYVIKVQKLEDFISIYC
jgi:RNA polymerase primary sigma factor